MPDTMPQTWEPNLFPLREVKCIALIRRTGEVQAWTRIGTQQGYRDECKTYGYEILTNIFEMEV